MRRLNWNTIAAATVALAVAMACGDDGGPTGPVSGTLVVSLTTPNADDGAILFTISGAGISAPTALTSNLFFSRVASTSSLAAVVAGNIAAGQMLRFSVPDVGQASAYTANITEVADRNNALRASLSGYVLSISRE